MDLELLARYLQFYSVILSTAPLSDFFKPNGPRVPTDALPNGTQAPTLEEVLDLEEPPLGHLCYEEEGSGVCG
jgi:hypothetical protein